MSAAVVVDTNILVRATLSGKGLNDAVLEKIGTGKLALVYSQEQLAELAEVLTYPRVEKKYAVNREIVEELLVWIDQVGRELEPVETNLCRDQDDNHIVGLALSAAKFKQVYLITGDRDILALKKKLKGITISTAGEFLRNAEG